MYGPRPLTIILAEDDVNLQSVLADVLRAEGHQVIEARHGGELMADLLLAHLRGSDSMRDFLVLTDLRLPGIDGLSVLRALRAQGRRPPFILMTALDDLPVQQQAAGLGALAVLVKPFDFDELTSVIRHAAQGRSDQQGAANASGTLW